MRMKTVKLEMNFISRLLDFSPYIKSLTYFYLHTTHNNHLRGLGNLHALWLAYKWEELATITHILSEEGMAQHPLIRRAREGAGLSQTTGKRHTLVDACKPSLNAQAADRYIWLGGYIECCGYHPSESRHFISPGSMNVGYDGSQLSPFPQNCSPAKLTCPLHGGQNAAVTGPVLWPQFRTPGKGHSDFRALCGLSQSPSCTTVMIQLLLVHHPASLLLTGAAESTLPP